MFILGLLLTFCAGLFGTRLLYQYKKGGFEKLAQEILSRAELQARTKEMALDLELKHKEFEHRNALEKQSEQKIQKINAQEEKIERQLSVIEKRIQEIEKREKELAQLKTETEKNAEQLKECNTLYVQKLELLSGISTEEAKQILLEHYIHEIQTECTNFLVKRKKEIEDEAQQYASSVIATAINRLSLPIVSEVAAIVIALPNHEMKGRIIGREGRNIRLLEQITGVNFVIDDTPNAVVISGFDPVRKEIARIALKELIQDGRIHPTRIEEAVAQAESKVLTQIKKYGEEAATQAGNLSFHPELLQLLGKLHFRYSNGQNVLAHSLQVCHLMGIIAAELQLNINLAKRIGLLHDIGKAISHEMEGSHALIGQQLALRYGESEEVANGIGCHHGEIVAQTVEASLCSAADTLSAARPGARSESLEYYLKRSARLEHISRQFAGVEKAYALQAGKEVRVIVEPDRFDDSSMAHLAREIAKKIEKELSYQGKIKVVVICEKKAIEYAA